MRVLPRALVLTGINLLLEKWVAHMDRDEARVGFGDGDNLQYHELLLAIGSSFNRCPYRA